MHQIVCRLGLCPLGELTALPRPPSWILGGLLLRGEATGREGKEGKRRGGEGEGRRGMREGTGSPPKLKLGPQNYFHGAGAGFTIVYVLLVRLVTTKVSYTSRTMMAKKSSEYKASCYHLPGP